MQYWQGKCFIITEACLRKAYGQPVINPVILKRHGPIEAAPAITWRLQVTVYIDSLVQDGWRLYISYGVTTVLC